MVQEANLNRPTLDLKDYKKKIEAGIFSWRYDEESDLVFLDVKQFDGGIDTGQVVSWPFSEHQLEKITNKHKGDILAIDNQILALREQKTEMERQFNASNKLITDAVKETVEKAQKSKK